MKEQYSVNEILNAIDDLQKINKSKIIDKKTIKKTIPKKGTGIPSNTLKLIEEAEKTIRSKLRSE